MSIRILVILVILGVVMPAIAQQSTSGNQPDTDQQSDQTGTAPQQTSEPDGQDAAQPDLPDFENEPIQRVEGQAPGRFIPSEQISQDLGVSFPTDI